MPANWENEITCWITWFSIITQSYDCMLTEPLTNQSLIVAPLSSSFLKNYSKSLPNFQTHKWEELVLEDFCAFIISLKIGLKRFLFNR